MDRFDFETKNKHIGPNPRLDAFTDRNIIRLGIETNCPHCRTANWHGIDATNYSIICERCLKTYPFPQASLRKDNKNWAYRVIGPFSVPDYARGSYGALLAISAVNRISSMTPHESMSFSTALSLNFDNKVREADFIAWKAETSFDGNKRPLLLVGEAKSLGTGELLTESDVEHMKDIGTKLPNAILVFSVLRDHFTAKEKKLLRSVVRWARRLDQRGGPTNRVLLLTSHELFETTFPIEHVWDKLGGVHKKFAGNRGHSDIRDIADATVEIHLGIPSFWEERRAAWEKRRKTKDEKDKSELPPGAYLGHMLIAINGE